MAYKDDTEILSKHGVKPTANRLLVFAAMKKMGHAFSLNDMEEELLSMDKSTIFRTLVLFLEQHLIHSVEDGSGSLKYCVCHNNGDCSPEEFHCHFYCEICHQTFCLEGIHIPIVSVPKGYSVREANYLLKGICVECKEN
ncbi:MAG: transcriptional repressor [Tannerella sp.]|jgi:Fur family ferric uptake transcriptional regulator|nr:transcriptional repressor [Tannerella sp.]